MAIVSSTNASPIALTVSGHGLTSGDVVDVYDHQTNTAANGRWTVTVSDANTFTLNGSTGNGVGGTTGHIIGRTLGANYQVPSDGDPLNASSISPLWTALGDRTEFLSLGVQSGSYAMQNWITFNFSSVITMSFTQWGTGSLSTTPSRITRNPSGTLNWQVPQVNEGDLLEIDVGLSALGGGTASWLFLKYDGAVPGGSAGSLSEIQGSGRPVAAAASNNAGGAIHIHGFVSIIPNFFGPGISGGNVDISLWGVTASSTDTVAMFGDYLVDVKTWRPQ